MIATVFLPVLLTAFCDLHCTFIALLTPSTTDAAEVLTPSKFTSQVAVSLPVKNR